MGPWHQAINRPGERADEKRVYVAPRTQVVPRQARRSALGGLALQGAGVLRKVISTERSAREPRLSSSSAARMAARIHAGGSDAGDDVSTSESDAPAEEGCLLLRMVSEGLHDSTDARALRRVLRNVGGASTKPLSE